MRWIAIFAALVLIPSSARAEEQVVRLKQAPGLDAVEGQCGACHSLQRLCEANRLKRHESGD